MRSEYREEFIKAALIEINVLEGHQTWIEVALSSADGSVIPCTWVFKIKRRSNGTIKSSRHVCV